MAPGLVDELVRIADEFIHNQSADLQDLLGGGAALLHGNSVYTYTRFVYPAPMAVLYAPLALLPLWLAWGVVLVVNLSILVAVVKRHALLWILYIPVLQVLLSGQNDLWFLFLERRLTRGTRSALLAALTTLKPQAAFVLLPYHVQRWWREDRWTLAQFAIFSAALWLAPWDHRSLFARARTVQNRFCAPSIWAVCWGVRGLPLPTIGLVLLSLLLIYVALTSTREAAMAALQMAVPVGMGKDATLMTGLAPAWLLLPLSSLFVLFILTGNSVPAYWAPLAVLLYHKLPHATADRNGPAQAGVREVVTGMPAAVNV